MGWRLRNKRWYYYETVYCNGRNFDLYLGGGDRGIAAEYFFKKYRIRRREVRRILADARRKLRAGPKAG